MAGGHEMDNFVDKIVQKFNAGEVIKANSAAEAKELKHMQETMAEYEECIQEMRKLVFKNAELTDQVSQLANVGIERLEATTMAVPEKIESEDISKILETTQESMTQIQNILTANKANVEELFKKMEEHIHTEDVKVYRNVQAAVAEEIGKQAESNGEMIKKEISKVSGLKGIMIMGLILIIANLLVMIAHILGLF